MLVPVIVARIRASVAPVGTYVFVFVTFGGEVFRTVPLSPLLWLVIIALTSLTLWGGELIRFFTARHEPS